MKITSIKSMSMAGTVEHDYSSRTLEAEIGIL